MKLTNMEMSNHLNSLNQISNKVRGRLGYAVARNIRKISEELVEFENIKLEYIYKYGTCNENGECVVKKGTKEYDQFLADIKEFVNISHEVDIYVIDPDLIMESDLTAKEIGTLNFMIND